MSDQLRLKIYFPPNTPLARLRSERDSFAESERRRAEYAAQVLRDYDAAIDAMTAAKEQEQEAKHAS